MLYLLNLGFYHFPPPWAGFVLDAEGNGRQGRIGGHWDFTFRRPDGKIGTLFGALYPQTSVIR